MSRCIVKQSIAQPVVSPMAQVSPVSVTPAAVSTVSVSLTEAAPEQPVCEVSGLFIIVVRQVNRGGARFQFPLFKQVPKAIPIFTFSKFFDLSF